MIGGREVSDIHITELCEYWEWMLRYSDWLKKRDGMDSKSPLVHPEAFGAPVHDFENQGKDNE